jgi:Rrf2 family nitric oxide-sensitive transcriptional repressor
MRLSSFSDYSLRVLVYVALCDGNRTTTDEIARAYGVSRNHLTKVVNTLSRLGYLATSKGRGGGLGLAREPEEISLGAVLRATEHSFQVVECLGNGPSTCPLTGICHMTDMFGEAREAFFQVFDRYTLADAAADPRRLALRLQLPGASGLQGKKALP